MSNQSVSRVMPIITVDSVDEAHAFYTQKLGFDHAMAVVGRDGQFDFATVILGGARIMFSRPEGPVEGVRSSNGKRPVEVYLEVADVEAYHEQLRRSGVEIAEPLKTQWWGDRTFKVKDPHGYEIWFYQNVAPPQPPEGAKIV